ncbi:hypothetical protein BAZSYMA_ACONTIG74906_0 [Bathymodiolus azoricus thioautotrophic gill symbiont]|uniref:Uncharacterized protein n=1 Tax=Bathymodiolus azoricus thioautotrophic gill symbiont TaxID=235205 RepID=A0A1H6K7D7_9GAMM|nr:hypothetical protein BAZSYMA_ACONTIG74906_0 [Bathymodiolus azoricus thioautotrophic gill symbiont]
MKITIQVLLQYVNLSCVKLNLATLYVYKSICEQTAFLVNTS